MSLLRIAIVQMNSVVGDLAGNAARMREFIARAKRRRADLVIFPELAVTGYPPEDLLLKPQFVTDNLKATAEVSRRVSGIAAVTGYVDQREGALYNAAAVMGNRRIIDTYHKMILPNYGVFDEHRYFREGTGAPVYRIGSARVGVNICEDIWHRNGPVSMQARSGAELIVNINASPYEMGKLHSREEILRERAHESRVMIIYVNMVGGQDELVFDGASMIVDHTGKMLARAKQFSEDFLVLDIDSAAVETARKKKSRISARPIMLPGYKGPARRRISAPPLQPAAGREEEVYQALVLGTGDYVRKNGFTGVVIGLSGGVDSSLVAAIAVDALGPSRVKGIFMPSRYTSRESREDAFRLAEQAGIEIIEIPIDGIFVSYMKALERDFRGRKTDVTEENLQARIRGNLLMAFSNKFGWLVLTTGNKSEMSVGYATLYGDMAGGFAVIKDVPKVLVYDLCRWKNAVSGSEVIPRRVLVKPPTAELRPNQKDTDSLPPYDLLDPVLKAYVEDEESFADIVSHGHDVEAAKRVISMVDRSEYKRRQAPPGVKVTSRAFGRDRRFPITNRYRSF